MIYAWSDVFDTHILVDRHLVEIVAWRHASGLWLNYLEQTVFDLLMAGF